MGGRAVSRSLVIILGIICAILAASLAVAAINYTSIISGKDREISLLNSQIAEKNNTISSLNSEIAKLRNQISSLNSEIITLQNQKRQLQTWLDGNRTLLEEKEAEINSLKSQIISLQDEISSLNSRITSLNSQIIDLQNQIFYSNSVIDSLKAPKLITVDLKIDDVRPIFGTPYIHIYGYVCNVGTNRAYNCRLRVVAYQGAVEAVNKYIVLGVIDGETWRKVDEKIYYTGSALTLIIVTPEWTASP